MLDESLESALSDETMNQNLWDALARSTKSLKYALMGLRRHDRATLALAVVGWQGTREIVARLEATVNSEHVSHPAACYGQHTSCDVSRPHGVSVPPNSPLF